MESNTYSYLDAVKKWIEENGTTIERVVSHIRKGWEKGERMEVSEGMWRADPKYQKSSYVEKCLKEEAELRPPSVGEEEVATVAGELRTVSSNNDSFPPLTPSSIPDQATILEQKQEKYRSLAQRLRNSLRKKEQAAPDEDTVPAEPTKEMPDADDPEGWDVNEIMSRVAAGSMDPELAAAYLKKGAGHPQESDRAPVQMPLDLNLNWMDVYYELTSLPHVLDCRRGKQRTQLMRDSIRLLDEVSLYELREMLQHMLANNSVWRSRTLVEVGVAALKLNANAVRHTIICLHHNKFHIPELDATWWPEQWYTDKHLDDAFDVLINRKTRFTFDHFKAELRKLDSGRVLRPGSWKNSLLRHRRAGRVKNVGIGFYMGSEKGSEESWTKRTGEHS